MDILTQQKFMKWAIAVLIIINLSTLAFLWLTKPEAIEQQEKTVQRDVPARGLIHFLKGELKLNDAQADSILKIRDEQHEKIQPLIQRIHRTKKQLVDGVFENWKQNNDSLTVEIGKLQSKIEMLTYIHLSRIKNVLGQGQKENFKKLVGEFFLNDRRPPQGGPPPRDRERRPSPPQK